MLYGSPYGRYGEAAFGGSTSPKDGGSAVSGPSDDVIALRHLRAGGGDCFGRLIARWSSFMHVSVYLEAESPCQFPVFQTTHFGALVRLLFHELLGLQLRRLLRWSSIGAREGFYLLCSLLNWVGLRARDFPTERVLSRTPLIIRTVDQIFWFFWGFGQTSVSRTSWASTAAATTMELYRRARGAPA